MLISLSFEGHLVIDERKHQWFEMPDPELKAWPAVASERPALMRTAVSKGITDWADVAVDNPGKAALINDVIKPA